jgi:dipeptidyl aminopeptidase/acylaminoacyl peptidase
MNPTLTRADIARPCILLLAMASGAAGAAPQATDLACITADAARHAPVAPVPLAGLLRRSPLQEVRIAPDGRHLAWLQADDKAPAVHVLDTASGTVRTVATPDGRVHLSWSGDGQVLFLDGAAGLSAAGLDGEAPRLLAPADKQRKVSFQPDPTQARALLGEERSAGHWKLERIQADGARTELAQMDHAPQDFLLDRAGKLAVIKTIEADFSQKVALRVGDSWRELVRCRPLRPCGLQALSGDGRTLFMTSVEEDDRTALVAIDTATGVRQVRHSDPELIADAGDAVLDPRTHEPLFASYRLPHLRHYAVSAAATAAGSDIAARFPDISVAITPTTGPWLLTESAPDRSADRYWLYEPATHGFREVLAAERAAAHPLEPDALAPVYAVTYPGSDGMPLHGYLALPPGRPARTLPLLTVVHGGPWSHFDDNYLWLAQLMATRGVAVFLPNFRASTGYGERYLTAAGSDYGNGRVQRDIIEGIDWLLANGVGDRARLGITGGSFGGYSTLLALTFEPGRFRFGVATSPPSDFARVMQEAVKHAGGDVPMSVRLNMAGLRLQDAGAMARIAAAAPAAHPDLVRAPLVIMAGGRDDKVAIGATRAYADALRKLGKAVTLMVDPDEGHNPRNPLARDAYAWYLERLAHEHLGAPAAETPPPALAAYLARTVEADGAFAAP